MTTAHEVRTQGAQPPWLQALPAWPVLLPFSAYALWWILGIGDFIWLIAGVVIVASWIGVRGLRLATPMIIWLVFLLWVVASLVMNDSSGRFLGAVYRLLLYLAAGLFAVHIFNARKTLGLLSATRAMVWFTAGMAACGYLGLAAPELRIRTPMAYVMPQGLLGNPLISDMVIRNTTQWNPNAWVVQDVRPVAPFLYANTWGNVYSLVAPLALLHVWLCLKAGRTREAFASLLVVIVSFPVALATLNRGMFIGLGVVLLWVAIQALRRGAIKHLAIGSAVFAIVGTAWWVSPLAASLFNRVSETESTKDRAGLYDATYQGTLSSPLFGYGGPRPAEAPWLPSLGTQGQFWTVMYSHGFVGLALFMLFLVVVFCLLIPRKDPVGAVLGGIMLATIMETFFYGMMTGIFVTMLAVGLALRGDRATDVGAVENTNAPGKAKGAAADQRIAGATSTSTSTSDY